LLNLIFCLVISFQLNLLFFVFLACAAGGRAAGGKRPKKKLLDVMSYFWGGPP
jgi:hypothetical protein